MIKTLIRAPNTTNLLMLQLDPINPSIQLQVKELTSSTHMPPFRQGLG